MFVIPQIITIASIAIAVALGLGFSATQAWLEFKYGIEEPIEPPLHRVQYTRTGIFVLALIIGCGLLGIVIGTFKPGLFASFTTSSLPVFLLFMTGIGLGERFAWHFQVRTARYAWRFAASFSAGLVAGWLLSNLVASSIEKLMNIKVSPSVILCIVAILVLFMLETLRRAYPSRRWPTRISFLAGLVKFVENQLQFLTYYLILFFLALSIIPHVLGAIEPNVPDNLIPPGLTSIIVVPESIINAAFWIILYIFSVYWATIMFYGTVSMHNLNLSKVEIKWRSDPMGTGPPRNENLILLVERREEYLVFEEPKDLPVGLQDAPSPVDILTILKSQVLSYKLKATWRSNSSKDI